jgi:hypothetical protein
MPTYNIRYVYRNSIDGKFVTKEYAQKHKKTTEKETVKVVPQKKPAPGKKK